MSPIWRRTVQPSPSTTRSTRVTHLRILDADAEGADWREVSRIVLHIDPEQEPDRARRSYDSHLARARWAARHGYRQLLGPAGHGNRFPWHVRDQGKSGLVQCRRRGAFLPPATASA